jgi:hypothetical protein
LLHMDGANGSTTFTDSSRNGLTVTANGNAQLSTTQSRFGGASGYFDGNGDWLSVASNPVMSFGTGDLTIENHVYFNSVSSFQTLYDTLPIGGSGQRDAGFVWLINDAGKLSLFSGGSFRGTSNTALLANEWYHIALIRYSGVFSFAINGTIDSSTFSLSTNFTDSQAQIGRLGDSADLWLNGYFSNFRVTKGVARDTANFTSPTAPFPNS